VGRLTYRRDERGLACLRWWRERCLEWCHDRVEAGRFAEQKYLDDWPERFPGVVVLRHPGASLAPWNLETHRLTVHEQGVRVDGEPLVFYHAHGLHYGGGGTPDLGLDQYGVAPTDLLRQHVYGPYLRALDEARRDVDAILGAARRGESSFSPPALADLAVYDRALPEREVTRLARRASLERLAECERDRAARLREIERVGAQFALADADRTARLGEIERIGAQLAQADADRIAVGAQLAQADADRIARLSEVERLGALLAQAISERTTLGRAVRRLEAQLTKRRRAAPGAPRPKGVKE
jgi:hypothetical protein